LRSVHLNSNYLLKLQTGNCGNQSSDS